MTKFQDDVASLVVQVAEFRNESCDDIINEAIDTAKDSTGTVGGNVLASLNRMLQAEIDLFVEENSDRFTDAGIAQAAYTYDVYHDPDRFHDSFGLIK